TAELTLPTSELFGLQNEITCFICQETLSDPVSILCGHSFCLKCLNDYWDQSHECSCPECRRTFTTRPELHRNTVLNELVKKIKKPRLSPHPSQNYASPGDVECDACTGMKFKAVKSCLTCMASYCPTHLQPHFEIAAWKDHKLTDPDGHLKVELCVKHHKRLEIFCKNEETCICMMCGLTEHEGHKKVELEMEKAEKQVSGTSGHPFEEPKSYENMRATRKKDIREAKRQQEKNTEDKATDDPKRFFQYFSSKRTVKETVKCIRNSKRELKHTDCKIAEALNLTSEEISSLVFFSPLSDFCPLTLDINTAHRDLRLSEGNKKVTHDDWTVTDYPDHPDRFDWSLQVLCREGLTGTRCYWEVECNECWVDIGVAYKGLRRKGWDFECKLGYNDKSWCYQYSQGHYSEYHTDRKMEISAPRSSRIGVYLDWPAGSLSFYSVSHTMTLLQRFSTTFTEPLYPGFSLKYHSSVTICHLTPCDH
uniref:Uncharacterized protein n=1 Tax=Erpetoichthys calabaricus TaxID=27687 RepID=A0A8C4T5W2_ERPCA